MMKYDKVIGTGGVGTGVLFISEIDETLGRNESRLALLSPAKDYCKLHIVFHYTAVLLKDNATVYPVSYVGDDPNGHKLRDEMTIAGMDTQYLGTTTDLPTMFGVCLQYPNKDGCNFSASNSACDLVTPEYIEQCFATIGINERSIVAAIPEVRLEARAKMLELAKEKGAFCSLTLASAETEQAKQMDIFRHCDLLVVNEEEAATICGTDSNNNEIIAQSLAEYLLNHYPHLNAIVTCGDEGAYTIYNNNIEHVPTLPVNVVNTTGAGDAFLGGTLGALAYGYPLQKGCNDTFFGQTSLQSAPELGTLCAGMAVECEDSIATVVTMESVSQRITSNKWECAKWFAKQH